MAQMELRSTVLAAIDQVENAITMEQAATKTVEAVRHQVKAAGDALDKSRTHYLQGLAPYVTVIAALGAHQAAQLALIEAERNRVDARIQLHTALGGHWVINTESPR
jgi:outer membrane protein TolC